MLLEESGSELGGKKKKKGGFLKLSSKTSLSVRDIYSVYMCLYCGKYFDSCRVSI